MRASFHSALCAVALAMLLLFSTTQAAFSLSITKSGADEVATTVSVDPTKASEVVHNAVADHAGELARYRASLEARLAALKAALEAADVKTPAACEPSAMTISPLASDAAAQAVMNTKACLRALHQLSKDIHQAVAARWLREHPSVSKHGRHVLKQLPQEPLIGDEPAILLTLPAQRRGAEPLEAAPRPALHRETGAGAEHAHSDPPPSSATTTDARGGRFGEEPASLADVYNFLTGWIADGVFDLGARAGGADGQPMVMAPHTLMSPSILRLPFEVDDEANEVEEAVDVGHQVMVDANDLVLNEDRDDEALIEEDEEQHADGPWMAARTVPEREGLPAVAVCTSKSAAATADDEEEGVATIQTGAILPAGAIAGLVVAVAFAAFLIFLVALETIPMVRDWLERRRHSEETPLKEGDRVTAAEDV